MKSLFQFWLIPKDISGGVLLIMKQLSTYIDAILRNLNLNSIKPPPKMSLGISQNDQFQTIFEEGT